MARHSYAWRLLEIVVVFLPIGAFAAYRQHQFYKEDNTVIRNHRLAIGREDLEPGDILLYREKKMSLVSALIRWVTCSPESHAAIYLGGNTILEADRPKVAINPLKITRGGHITVLRSQLGFDASRVKILLDFADQLIRNRTRYDLRGALQFAGIRSADYECTIKAVMSKSEGIQGDARTKYFCSALVARIWCLVGIADESAWGLFLEDLISPGDIVGNPNFGWLRGYLIPPGSSIPEGDEARFAAIWKDVEDAS